MKLYALALKAKKSESGGVKIEMKAACTTNAATDEEAIGWGMRLAKEQWPTSDGWYNHGASYCEIPDEIFRQVCPAAPASAPVANGGDEQEHDGEV